MPPEAKEQLRSKQQAYHRERIQRPGVRERRNETSREWNRNNADKCKRTIKVWLEERGGRDYHKDWKLKKTYGLTLMDYQNLEDMQGGVCAICWLPETSRTQTGVVRRLHVDHDHQTGEVRGLLCHACNHGVGNFKDDLELLDRAKDYLKGTLT